jgi:hypothetical protein
MTVGDEVAAAAASGESTPLPVDGVALGAGEAPRLLDRRQRLGRLKWQVIGFGRSGVGLNLDWLGRIRLLDVGLLAVRAGVIGLNAVIGGGQEQRGRAGFALIWLRGGGWRVIYRRLLAGLWLNIGLVLFGHVGFSLSDLSVAYIP